MIKLRAEETFTLGEFYKIKNLKRYSEVRNQEGYLYTFDEFECEEELAKYLLNETPNPVGRAVVEIVEVVPKKKPEEPEEPKKKEKKATTKRTPKAKK